MPWQYRWTGDGVVFLQGGKGRRAIGSDGNKLGFEILSDADGAVDDLVGKAHALAFYLANQGVDLVVKGIEASDGDSGIFNPIGEVDDADGPDGVNKALFVAESRVVFVVRLAFVGNQHGQSVGGKGEVVGKRARLDGIEEGAGGRIQECHEAVVGIDGVLQGNGNDAIADGNAVGTADVIDAQGR